MGEGPSSSSADCGHGRRPKAPVQQEFLGGAGRGYSARTTAASSARPGRHAVPRRGTSSDARAHVEQLGQGLRTPSSPRFHPCRIPAAHSRRAYRPAPDHPRSPQARRAELNHLHRRRRDAPPATPSSAKPLLGTSRNHHHHHVQRLPRPAVQPRAHTHQHPFRRRASDHSAGPVGRAARGRRRAPARRQRRACRPGWKRPACCVAADFVRAQAATAWAARSRRRLAS